MESANHLPSFRDRFDDVFWQRQLAEAAFKPIHDLGVDRSAALVGGLDHPRL
jgi:hypothetical protein